MTQIRTIIAAERTLFRQGLVALVGADQLFVVVGEASDPDEARRTAEREHPELIVLDSDLTRAEGGCEIVSRLRAACPAAAIVVLGEADRTSSPEAAAEEALRSERAQARGQGADAYLPARADRSELLRVLSAATATKKCADDDGHAASNIPHWPVRSGHRHRITEREQAIVALIAQGLCNKEVAHRLGISTGTVKNHVSHLLEKLALADRTQLAVYAVEHHFEF